MVKLENSRVELTVDIDAEALEKAIDEGYRKTAKKISIPGFRKGKAPRQIIELNYGPDIFLEDAVDILLPQAYQKALDETEIRPVDQPDVDIEKVERGVGITFIFEVDVYPELELGNYKGLEAQKEIVKVTDEDVLNVLKQQQERSAQLIVVDRTDVQEGDFAVIDFIGYVDGQPFSGGAGEDHTLEIGSGQFIPGFEEQLIGAQVGEAQEIQVTFPEEYHAEALAGQDATFKVTVKELKEKSLPELDDEFAKDISEHETLDELKAEIRKNLEDDVTRRTTSKVENTLLELIAADSKVEIPQSMIDHQAEHQLEHFLENMQYQGLNEEMYYQITGQTREDLLVEFEPTAKTQIINDLIIDAVVEAEGIEVTEDEVNTKISELMGTTEEMDPELEETMRKYWESQRKGIELSLVREKAMKFIVDQAQITEVEALDDEAVETEEV
jgi:trigger factor